MQKLDQFEIKKSISFVVIGRNEARFLNGCFESIGALRQRVSEVLFEVIYVDSDSTDQSRDIALNSKYVDKVIKLKGAVNSAIGRNVGAAHAKGDILCFVDGDMYVEPQSFIKLIKIVCDEKKLFVSGDFIDVEYDAENIIERRIKRHNLKKEESSAKTGGLFIIKAELWHEVGGMRNVFRRSQDLDLALRIAEHGHLLYRTADVVAEHNTVSYIDPRRFYRDFFKGNFLYLGLLVRKNFFNKYTHQLYFKSYLSGLLLLFFASALTLDFYFILGYVVALFFKVALLPRNFKRIFKSLFDQVLVDVSFLFGFFFFYPNKKSMNYSVEVIKE